jgi:hypothetical protein
MNEAPITYVTRPDATPEAELGALRSVYAFILQKHRERQKATLPGSPDDAKEIKNDSRHCHRNT